MTWYRRDERNDELLLELHVQPGAARSAIAGLHGKRLKLRLAAPPVDGKANAALIDFLAGKLGVPRRDLRIAAGEAARIKRVAIRGLSGPPAGLVEEVERGA